MRRQIAMITVAALIAAGLVIKAIVPKESDATPEAPKTAVRYARSIHGLYVALPPNVRTIPEQVLAEP
jgi:hypothetical protein